MAKVLDHVHTWMRSPRDNQYYLCRDPHCSTKKHRKDLNGKASICNFCGAEFVLTWTELDYAKPKCMNCSKSKEAQHFRELTAQIANVVTPRPNPDEVMEQESTQPFLDLTSDDIELLEDASGEKSV